VSVALSSFGAFARECDEIRGQVLRFHVLANSDSEEDQALKLRVRDAVLAGTANMPVFGGSKEENAHGAAEHLAEHLDIIEKIARTEIKAAGYTYEARAQIVNMYFETRDYSGVIMPAGRYDAVRLSIGAGEGENWWCVMFPPMCIPAACDRQSLDLEEQIARLGTQPRYIPKFAIVEWIEQLLY